MSQNCTIRIRNYEQACAALKVAVEMNRPIILENAKGTYRDAGLLYIKEAIEQALEDFPEAQVKAVFNAGDATIIAISAINCGFKRVRFTGDREWIEKISDIAKHKDVELITEEDVDAFELNDMKDPYEQCLDYMNKRVF